jgi:hypothetical protein
MGWLVRYFGKKATIEVPTKGRIEVHKGDTFDLPPTGAVRSMVYDPGSPWERLDPNHPDYVAPEDR